MTSHELRNPLSAVVQCAESAIITLTKLSPQSSTITPTATYGVEYTRDFQEEIDSTIDSLQTIITCSLHQKRVVDDVLTLSKLDSELVVITPVRVQAAVVILEAIKMFDMECQKMGIRLDFQEDESAREFAWVMLDPSRMVQILINLMCVVLKLYCVQY
jgi:signal transduction histidine kinase